MAREVLRFGRKPSFPQGPMTLTTGQTCSYLPQTYVSLSLKLFLLNTTFYFRIKLGFPTWEILLRIKKKNLNSDTFYLNSEYSDVLGIRGRDVAANNAK